MIRGYYGNIDVRTFVEPPKAFVRIEADADARTSREHYRAGIDVDFGGKRRCNYSFATKYCSWHRPGFYPIYDSRVDYVLRVYARQKSFSKFTQETLWNYPEFHRVVCDFRHSFGLESYSFKETDKFLYQLGNDFLGEYPPVVEDPSA